MCLQRAAAPKGRAASSGAMHRVHKSMLKTRAGEGLSTFDANCSKFSLIGVVLGIYILFQWVSRLAAINPNGKSSKLGLGEN